MATGKVKWFNDHKGFGFIQEEQTGKDVFEHHTVIESQGYRTLTDGETVDYEESLQPPGRRRNRRVHLRRKQPGRAAHGEVT